MTRLKENENFRAYCHGVLSTRDLIESFRDEIDYLFANNLSQFLCYTKEIKEMIRDVIMDEKSAEAYELCEMYKSVHLSSITNKVKKDALEQAREMMVTLNKKVDYIFKNMRAHFFGNADVKEATPEKSKGALISSPEPPKKDTPKKETPKKGGVSAKKATPSPAELGREVRIVEEASVAETAEPMDMSKVEEELPKEVEDTFLKGKGDEGLLLEACKVVSNKYFYENYRDLCFNINYARKEEYIAKLQENEVVFGLFVLHCKATMKHKPDIKSLKKMVKKSIDEEWEHLILPKMRDIKKMESKLDAEEDGELEPEEYEYDEESEDESLKSAREGPAVV